MTENNGNWSTLFLGWFLKFVTRTDLNRIWRAKFITASVIFSILVSIASAAFSFLWTLFDSVLSYPIFTIVFDVIIFALSLYGSVYINNKRLHDFWKSWWWQLLLFLPIANIVMILIMWFYPWDKVDNQYWSASETTGFEKVWAWLFPILVAFFVCWVFAAALLPRVKWAQSAAYDSVRRADLSSLQSSIVVYYNGHWEYPLAEEASNWIPASKLSSILSAEWYDNSYSDPVDNETLNSWLWNATSKWDYLYMVTTMNTIPRWAFVLLALAGSKSNSNWVVCDNWEWNIPSWYDLSDLNLCSSPVEWNVCANDFKWNCTYTSKDQLRYLLSF